jgi:hypothetical protein
MANTPEIDLGPNAISIMQQIVYANVSDNPPASVQIDWAFNDGNTGSQGTGGAVRADRGRTLLLAGRDRRVATLATMLDPLTAKERRRLATAAAIIERMLDGGS